MINTQQLIVLLPLFKINLPANAGIFFRQLMSIAAFEFFEIGEFTNSVLGMEATSPVDENYNAVGFESVYFINNMGTLFILFLLCPLAMLIEYILRKMAQKWDRVLKVHQAIANKVYWTAIITLTLESYSMVVICCLIHFEYISFSGPGYVLQSLLAIFSFLALVWFPIHASRLFVKNFKFLDYKQVY